MITPQQAKDLQILLDIPLKITEPAFITNKPLWVKSDTHPDIPDTSITSKRYQYTKNGKIFAFQRTRYITFCKDYFFYFQEKNDLKFKGYCCFQNIYYAFYPLKNKRYLFYLSNGKEQSYFFFENDQFFKTVKKSIDKVAILLNFSDTYAIQNNLGKGSFSQVYLVKNKETKKLYAAKVVSKLDKNKAPTKNLVLQERKILQNINSQFVYQFYEFYEESDNYIFILEYLTGKDLMTLFKEQTEFAMGELIYIFRSVLKGLSDSHKLKIYHRDLKPQNIIINQSTSKPKIIDFGLSLMITPCTELKSFKRCGTMGYMAPQVIANTAQIRKPYSQKCDIFSFGIIAHMILLGRNPLKGKNYEQTYAKNKMCEIQLDKQQILEKYGEDGYFFLFKLLQKNPKLRWTAEQALKSKFLVKYHHQKQFLMKQDSAQTASQQIKINKPKSHHQMMSSFKVGKQKIGRDDIAVKVQNQQILFQ